MKINNPILIIAILSLLVLTACGTRNSNLPITQADIYKGTDGITMRFIENAPPAEIIENNEFRVGVELKNDGAGKQANGYLLIGYESDYMELMRDNKISYSLDGRNLNSLYGEQERMMFDFTAKGVDELATHHLSTIYATTCYEFQTDATTSICVDTDMFNEKAGQKTCTASDVSLSDQGAPVAVRKVEQTMLPTENDRIKPIFNIYVENVGNGKVLAKGSTDKACSSQGLSRTEDLNVITITAKLGEDVLQCSPTPLQLISDSDYVRCSLEQGIDANFVTFTSLLHITLNYGYMNTISTNIDIKKIN